MDNVFTVTKIGDWVSVDGEKDGAWGRVTLTRKVRTDDDGRQYFLLDATKWYLDELADNGVTYNPHP